MRHRLSMFGIVLLVAIVVLGGVTGCERSAEKRSPDTTATTGAVEPGGSTSGGDEGSPAAGQTVVSVATGVGSSQPPAGSATEVPPGTSGGETPVAPAATDTPGAGSLPVATQPPSTGGTTGTGAVHTVKAGETLYSIARMYGTTVDAIVAANSLANPSVLVVGQKLTIPGASGSSGSTSGGTSSGSTGSTTGCRINHTVKPGEWVWQIARDYNVSPYDILSANGLTINTARWVYPGQVLCIP